MRALSLWQPWAWLVANGWKPIENRPWNCHFRERILIHAGRRYSFEQYHEVRNWCLRHGFETTDRAGAIATERTG